MSGQQRHLRTRPKTRPDALESDTAPARHPPPATATSVEFLRRLERCGTTVAAIGSALALSPDRLARAEAPDRLELDTDLPLAALDSLDAPAVGGWFAVLGPDLRIDLTPSGGGSQPSIEPASLRAGRDPTRTLADFLDAVHQAERDSGDEVTVNLRLAIAKAGALETTAAVLALRPEYFGTPEMLAHTTIAVFYFAAAFHRLLGMHALAGWERLGFAREDGRAVVVLCDQAGYLAGVALEVVGPRIDAEPRWLTVSRAGFRQFRQRAEQTRALRDEEGGWAAAPHVLTPAHLRAAPRMPGLEDTAARLDNFQCGLAAAYLADSVHTSAGTEYALRFAGPRPAICRIPAKTATAIAAESATGPLARLCVWAYDNASPDKLAIARECLARELPHSAEMSLAEVNFAAAGALGAAKANFTLYLRRNTEQYFAVRQKALDAVADYAASVRKSVSDLTSDVVDNVYRTAGLLVGVVIAGLIQPSLSLGVARLAAAVYVLYIALLLAFFMQARRRRFELEKTSLDQQLAAMQELGAAERETLRRQPADAEGYFTAYFQRAWWIYVGLGAAGLLIFLLLWTPLALLTGLPHGALPTPTHALTH